MNFTDHYYWSQAHAEYAYSSDYSTLDIALEDFVKIEDKGSDGKGILGVLPQCQITTTSMTVL